MLRVSYQLPPERLTTEMGLQVRPTRTSTPWTTMPSKPRRVEAAGSVACVVDSCQYAAALAEIRRERPKVQRTFWTELQHWRSPVVHCPALVGVEAGAVTVTVVVFDAGGDPPGMAAARRVRESTK